MTRLVLPLLFLTTWAISASAIEFHLQDTEAPDASSGLSIDQASPEQGVPAADDVSLGDCCCDCCCPSWTARVDYVYLWRDDLSDVPITGPTGGGAPIFSASQFEFDAKSGIDASVVYDIGCGKGLEIRYFWVDDFSDNAIATTTVDFSLLTNPPTAIGSGPRDILLFYQSELQSGEILARYCMGRIDVSYGFRYVELNESLVHFNNPPAFANPVTDRFSANNDLYGFQLGADSRLYDNCCGLRIDGVAKVGVFYNEASASVSEVVDGNAGNNNAGSDNDSDTAFLTELGVTANYDIRCDVSLRAGYSLLFVDGVALAADQVSNTGSLAGGNNNTPVTVEMDNSVLYHGLHFGLEYRR